MASNTQVTTLGYGVKVVDKRKAASSVPNNPVSSTLFNATKDPAAMRAQLTTYNGTYYTSARLDQMTVRDMIYALRLAYDSAGM